MMSEYLLGMSSAIVLVVLIAIVYAVRKKTCIMRGKFDERQKVIQGTGYKYGFFAMMISSSIYALALGWYDLPIHPTVGIMACVLIGVGVFAGYCIWKDAYFGIQGNNKRMIIVMVAVVVMNALSAAMQIKEGTIIENGVIGITALNALCAMVFFAILVVIFAKSWKVSKEDKYFGEDDE